MRARPWALVLFLESLGLLLFELLLTRIFAIVMFAQFAHLAISLTLLGISVGAVAVHLWPRIAPPEKLASRLGLLALVAAASMLVATVLSVELVFTGTSVDLGADTSTFRQRKSLASSLADWRSLAILFPAVALPFACGGVTFATIFRDQRERIGSLYAADLAGGAVGCLAFIPVLWTVSAPDAVFVAGLVMALAGVVLFWSAGGKVGVALALVVAMTLGTFAALGTRRELFGIQHAAGFSEKYVTQVQWTPLARIAVWEPPRKFDTYLMLDNTSRSRVVTDQAAIERSFARNVWSAAFALVRSPGKIMILAAGAGGEVTAARSFGHRDITAVELMGAYFDIVRTRFRDVPGNPYRLAGVRRLEMDARSAVKHSTERYDLIEMMQANFFSLGGMLSEAWDPRILLTREAFGDYLGHLTRDGMVSIGGGPSTTTVATATIAALRRRGVRHPLRCIALLRSPSQRGHRTLLVRPRPFTRSEARALRELATKNGFSLVLDPGWPEARARDVARRRLGSAAALTDDHPYNDSLATFGIGARPTGEAAGFLQRILVTQIELLLGFGVLLLGVPYLWRGRGAVARVLRPGPALAYCAALGFAYMGVEIVLVHALILFVGHPTYAVTVVILSLLLGSGAGSLAVARIPEDRLDHFRRLALPAVLVVAAAHAFAISPLLSAHVLGLPIPLRLAIAAATLLPLGFLMGTPFPMGMRLLGPGAGPIVPWCWALNGWTSVVAGALVIFVARLWGYRVAFSLTLLAYLAAYLLSTGLRRVGQGS